VLFVIDTVAPLTPHMPGLDASTRDAKLMRWIGEVARKTGCCILAITQANKRYDVENITDRLAHTNQFAAAADDIIMTYRKKNDTEKRRFFSAIGRSIKETDELVLKLDHTGLHLLGRSLDILATEEQRAIAAQLRKAAPVPLGAKELAARLDKKRETVRNTLYRMEGHGLVVGVEGGRYLLPEDARKQMDEAPGKALGKALGKAPGKALLKGTGQGTGQGTRSGT
jgi:hypothetical protein